MNPTTAPDLDLVRLRRKYEWAEQRYLKSLPMEHFMESTPQATQREITLSSFALIRVSRPDVQCFNELLVQYPRPGRDPEVPGQVVPDNMVVIHHKPIVAVGSYMTPLQPVNPLLVLEYVSKSSAWKDEEVSYVKYEELAIPYYLLFYPEANELTLFRMKDSKYVAIPPDGNGRYAIPELELEVGLLGEWMRYWFRRELLPLSGELLEQLTATKTELTAVKNERDAERQTRLALEAELTRLRAQLAKPE